MAYPQYANIASELWGISPELALAILTVIGVWSLTWKGFALWKAAGKKQLIWFIALLIVNTAGILEIFYIFIFSKLGRNQSIEHKKHHTEHKKKKKR